MIKLPSSVKCMFPDLSSDSDSDDSSDSDSDDEGSKSSLRRPRRSLEGPIPAWIIESFKPAHKTAPGNSNRDKARKTNFHIDIGEPGLFVIDSTGGAGNLGVKKTDKRSHTPLDPGVDLTKNLYIDLDVLNRFNQKETAAEKDDADQKESEIVTELMKKATFKPAQEKNPSLPRVSKAELKRRRKAEREKTKGRDWFDMPATELTEERRRDLEIMQLRDALDPKRRYRSDDRAVLPKYFQVGTVIEHPTDFYHSRIPRKERKQTIVDELLADDEFQKRSKRKYAEIVQEKTRFHKRDAPSGDDEKTKRKKKKQKMNN